MLIEASEKMCEQLFIVIWGRPLKGNTAILEKCRDTEFQQKQKQYSFYIKGIKKLQLSKPDLQESKDDRCCTELTVAVTAGP